MFMTEWMRRPAVFAASRISAASSSFDDRLHLDGVEAGLARQREALAIGQVLGQQ